MIPELVTVVAIAAPGATEAVALDDLHVREPKVYRSLVCGRECRRRKYWRRVVRPHRPWLRSLRWCESGNRPFVNTGNGYYGAYQFDLQTWRSVGGFGYPHQASLLEQSYRAVLLLRRRGTAPWPVCG